MNARRQARYWFLILDSLVKRGGKARTAEVLADVEAALWEELTDKDYELVGGSTSDHWLRRDARFAREDMIPAGLLRSDSPHGIWEITVSGRHWWFVRMLERIAESLARQGELINLLREDLAEPSNSDQFGSLAVPGKHVFRNGHRPFDQQELRFE